jgi:hypothetical protein
LDNYETERAKLLHNEENHDVLWRVVVAADTLAETVAWWESYDNDDANI